MRLTGYLATTAMVAGLAAGAARADTIQFRIGAGHPPNATWTTAMREYFETEVTARVKAATGDDVTWVEAYGGSVCKLGECLEAVESGLLDMADVESIFEPAKLQAQNFSLFVPFSTPDPRLNAKVINEVYDAVPALKDMMETKYNQVFLGAGVIGDYGVLTTFDWSDASDLAEHKIAVGGPNLPWIAPTGAVPVQAVLPEVYTSLQTGVYQGVVMFPDAVMSFKLNEVAKTFGEVHFGTVASAMITVNKDTFDSLKPEVQQILRDVGRDWSIDLGDRTAKLQDAALQAMKDGGMNVFELTDDQRKAWAASLENLPKERYDEIMANGGPGEAIYEYIRLLQEAGYTFPRDWAAEK